ncbi:DUF4238 domain-containing protein [uncultured Chitinophaga sp.]|uniref:DUF4238 domain-containing protein n=1 Tax=uncultured Chitinophaga sp. TaxID=339340 RepID=UPI0025D3A1E4|nr:DUF4238 domain-containing protein [uncultured Chitinophaga sp.]
MSFESTKDTKSEAKRHHYVPKCYLKNFCSGDKLYYLNLENIQRKGFRSFAKKCHPRTICTEDYYYKIPSEDVQMTSFSLNQWDSLFVENEVLQSTEREYGRLFTLITSGQEISIDDANLFCDFLVQLKMRNPYHAKTYTIETLENVMEILLTELDHPGAPFANMDKEIKKAVAKQMLDENREDPDLKKKLQLQSLIHSYENINRRIKFRNALCKLRWHVLRAPENGTRYITSDNPGFVFLNDQTFYNLKLTGEGFLFLPLSSTYCLAIDLTEQEIVDVAKVTSKRILHSSNSSKAVEYVNARSCQLINNVVISSDQALLNKLSEKLQKYVKRDGDNWLNSFFTVNQTGN